MSLDENKAGAAAVDPSDFNTVVDAVVTLQAGGGSLPAGGTTGQVLTKASNADGDADWEPGGGSTAGAPVVRGPFSFAFNTANLNDGVAFYTPTVGDFLLDAWVVVDTAWDGDTPRIDIGTGIGTVYGLWDANSGINATGADISAANDTHGGGTGLLYNPVFANSNVTLAAAGAPVRIVPALFTAANPLKVWVSQDAAIGGDAPGAAQGAARLFIVTATPVAF